MLVIKGQACQEKGLNLEWAEGNLKGSYIYNNLLCHNSKEAHSFLTIVHEQRLLPLVSTVIEKVQIKDNTYYTNSILKSSENKNVFLEKFYIDECQNFLFNFFGKKLLKSILLTADKNLTIIRYKLIQDIGKLNLNIFPCISEKNNSKLQKQKDTLKYKIAKEENYIKFSYSDEINLFFYFGNNTYVDNQQTIKNNQMEKEDDYVVPGEFLFKLTEENNECFFGIASDRLKEKDLSRIFDSEIENRRAIYKKLKIKNELFKSIVISSHFFIKEKNQVHYISNSLLSEEVNYQELINSLNIFFILKNFDVIKKLMVFLSKNLDKGLQRHVSEVKNEDLDYKSIDDVFWFLLVVLKYIELTGDWKFIKDFIWGKLKSIFHDYLNNQIPGITIDFDGLLLLNSDTGDTFNTGRLIEYHSGKNIALNILWYNAIRIMELLSAKYADIEYHTRTERLSVIIQKNFFNKFRNKKEEYFYNRVDIPDTKKTDDSIRPYAVMLLSLPYDDLIYAKTKWKIIEYVKEHLLVSCGLVTLSKKSNKYIPVCDKAEPGSFYNGIIHPYLLFHYLTGILKVNNYSKPAKREVKEILEKFEKKLKTNIIGFFPQFINSDETYNSSGIPDYAFTLSEYLKLRSEELASF